MTGQLDHHRRHEEHGILSSLGRLLLVFFVLTVWCFVLSVAYAYGGRYGWIDWLRLPEGLTPFLDLNLTIADIGALAALFVAILLAATVQLNSTVSAGDEIAAQVPSTVEEELDVRHRLRYFANQAEISMLVSYGAAFTVLMLTVLYALSDLATYPGADAVNEQGIGWVGFFNVANELAHPRIVVMFVLSLLLFLATSSSMPEWKNTGLFQRQVEGSAVESARRLRTIAEHHNLRTVTPIRHPGWALAATIVGYLAYVSLFALMLNLLLAVLVGTDSYDGFFSSDHRVLFLVFAIFASLISVSVASVMLWVHHLHGQTNIALVASLILGFAGLLFVMTGEGVRWALAVTIAAVLYALWWAFLYWRGANVLDGADPDTWEYLLNPPKFIIVNRYETIRRSAAQVLGEDIIIRAESGEDLQDGSEPR